jgi:hypothetical protein
MIVPCLHSSRKHHYLNELIKKPDQGKTFKLINRSEDSNHWINRGKFLRFGDWNFIHSARLNTLPLRGCQRNTRQIRNPDDLKCRKCRKEHETLPHVLNACPINYPLMTERHDNIVERIKKAIPPSKTTKIIEDSAIDSVDNLRPD